MTNNLSPPLTGSRVVFPAQPYPSDRFASASQFLATVLVSVALVVVFVASFASPPETSRLGLSVGILLVLFSLCQMMAFSLMAAAITERESISSFFASMLPGICLCLVLA